MPARELSFRRTGDLSVAGPSFARGLWRIAAADVSSGNRVVLLRDGPATFDSMIDLIENASTSIALESYIFRSDEVGRRFADALSRAAKRGLNVRLLLDWIGARGTSHRFIKDIRRSGVEVAIFNPFGLRRWLGVVPRDHRKLLVVDDRIGITGGVGVGREWTTGVQKLHRSRWRDTAVVIDGPAAHDMTRAFEHMWRRTAGHERRGSHRFLRRPARGAHLDPATDTPALVGIVEGEPLRLRVSRALQIQAISAHRSIWIATAYFTPSPSEVEALNGAARDGVDVRILVPSRNDHPWMSLVARRFYRRLLTNGVRIWEWQGEMMHAKTSVIDGRWVRVGSTDFNPLGVAINYELDAVIEDVRLGAEAEEMFLADLEISREVQLQGVAQS
ncbi:MAG TPA: phosphatidylserine/phosphatidylglycerophosphate/cardiolipin synthase family protein [Gemmatimonadaceae bacterium]|nr:phosphatidylserine/phosphatidylglycerophosphate/cardiolipin synthase family protein [Gemmatimonadaceae bacterium]